MNTVTMQLLDILLQQRLTNDEVLAASIQV
jgi:hypothetical protein